MVKVCKSTNNNLYLNSKPGKKFHWECKMGDMWAIYMTAINCCK